MKHLVDDLSIIPINTGFEEDAERYHLLYVDHRLQHVPSCLMQAFIIAFSSVTTPLSFTQDQKDVTATQLLLDRWGHLSKMRQEVKSTSCCGWGRELAVC